MLANILTGFNTLAMLTPPSAAEYLAIIPGSIVAIVAMVVLLVDTFHRPGTRRDYLAYISAIGLGLAGLSAYLLWDNTLDKTTFHGMLYLDRFANRLISSFSRSPSFSPLIPLFCRMAVKGS